MRIAIDAMGGDHAPREIVRGAVEAVRKHPDIRLILVGAEDKISNELDEVGGVPAGIEVQNATQTIDMDEEPVAALRRKTDSSLRVALRQVKSGKAEAIISAGNTGALVGGAMIGLRPLEGVKRPGIAVPLPTESGFCAVIDVGANPNCKPIHLLQYGVMGAMYVKYLKKDVAEPTVGMLNIGEESTKGNDVIREAYAQFKKSSLNFIGNVEPHKMFRGEVDVVVCDGFVGNLMLKMAEGVGGFIHSQFSNGLKSNQGDNAAVAKILEKLDYSTYGGAPLLGVSSVVIKCHGRSKAKAITNGVDLAGEFIRGQLNSHIVEEIKKMSWWGRIQDWWTKKEEMA